MLEGAERVKEELMARDAAKAAEREEAYRLRVSRGQTMGALTDAAAAAAAAKTAAAAAASSNNSTLEDRLREMERKYQDLEQRFNNQTAEHERLSANHQRLADRHRNVQISNALWRFKLESDIEELKKDLARRLRR